MAKVRDGQVFCLNKETVAFHSDERLNKEKWKNGRKKKKPCDICVTSVALLIEAVPP